MVSTVSWNAEDSSTDGVGGLLGRPAVDDVGVKGDGEPDLVNSSCDSEEMDEIMLPLISLSLDPLGPVDGSRSLAPKKPDPTRLGKKGVWVPEVGRAEAGWRASLDACSRRFVVPRALVCDDRAEHTIATLLLGRYDLEQTAKVSSELRRGRYMPLKVLWTHATILVILSSDFPTLVPPYF